MINNNTLRELYEYKDRGVAIRVLKDRLYGEKEEFLKEISCNSPELKNCTEDEIKFLTDISGHIAFLSNDDNTSIPDWVFEKELEVKNSVYYNKLSF